MIVLRGGRIQIGDSRGEIVRMVGGDMRNQGRGSVLLFLLINLEVYKKTC